MMNIETDECGGDCQAGGKHYREYDHLVADLRFAKTLSKNQ